MAGKEGEKSAALKLAEEIQRRPFAAAAIAGGAAAAAAGAVLGARALAKRNGGNVNSVLKAAITASEAASACQAQEASAAPEAAAAEAEAHPS
ncbi:MAG TPA: hypothetical protein VGB59_08480 [Allosphingosinicella sp.]|jgi:hypothetical protein